MALRAAFSAQALSVAVLAVVPLCLFFFLVFNPEYDLAITIPTEHFIIVSVTSGMALILGLMTSLAAYRLNAPSVLLLSLSFLGIAGIFSVHGLTTSGVIHEGFNPVTGISARLSILTGAIFFALSAAPLSAEQKQWIQEHRAQIIGGMFIFLVLYAVCGLLFTDTFTLLTPLMAPPVSYAIAAVVIGLYLYAAKRYWDLYTLARLPLQASFAIGAVFLAEAQIAMFAPTWRLSWGVYHLLMLAGFLLGTLQFLAAYGKGKGAADVMRGVFVLSGIVELALEHEETIACLAAATEAKDPYTQGHTVRVAEYAVRIGREMGLPPERLRVLARSGLLHDIGKLGIRDAVLLKPGKLTDEEFAHIQEHPKLGHDILRRVGSLETEIRVIAAHHERVDGAGYPAGLKGEQIPLEARILAVADVYDALTTQRPYRDPSAPEEACALIKNEAGSHFDRECVAAFLRTVEIQQGVVHGTSSNPSGRR